MTFVISAVATGATAADWMSSCGLAFACRWTSRAPSATTGSWSTTPCSCGQRMRVRRCSTSAGSAGRWRAGGCGDGVRMVGGDRRLSSGTGLRGTAVPVLTARLWGLHTHLPMSLVESCESPRLHCGICYRNWSCVYPARHPRMALLFRPAVAVGPLRQARVRVHAGSVLIASSPCPASPFRHKYSQNT